MYMAKLCHIKAWPPWSHRVRRERHRTGRTGNLILVALEHHPRPLLPQLLKSSWPNPCSRTATRSGGVSSASSPYSHSLPCSCSLFPC
ncbi:hypothetical protein FJTKL_11300 [Diaporthe vaccinii]|uniref:Uncharacterized protein n=1 Tax=Diaporthe vaccinii TaxID=105482 RepID=A0ABR4EHB8_9PEZI